MSKYRNVITPSIYGPIIINRYDTVIGSFIGTYGAWEKDQIEFIKSVLAACTKPEHAISIIDVGANIGTHTLAFSQFPFSRVTVHAFEAQRPIFYMLAGTVALNSLDHVYCYNKAVSDQSNQKITIPVVDYDTPGNFGGVEIEKAVNPDFEYKVLADSYEQIETAQIDDFSFENLRFIKIDVEGMENKVLKGASKTIDLHRPLLFLEYSKTDFGDVLKFLRGKNYKSYFVHRPNVLCMPSELEIVIKGAELVEE
jgi:FkbM family methyltransferase